MCVRAGGLDLPRRVSVLPLVCFRPEPLPLLAFELVLPPLLVSLALMFIVVGVLLKTATYLFGPLPRRLLVEARLDVAELLGLLLSFFLFAELRDPRVPLALLADELDDELNDDEAERTAAADDAK